MATTPIPVPTTIHPSFWAKAGTWFLKIGQSVKNTLLKVVGASAVVDTELKKVAPTLEALSNLVLPGSGTFEEHVLDVWGVVASAVHAAGDAATANGVSVSLDAQLIADIKAILPAVQQYMHPSAGPTPTK